MAQLDGRTDKQKSTVQTVKTTTNTTTQAAAMADEATTAATLTQHSSNVTSQKDTCNTSPMILPSSDDNPPAREPAARHAQAVLD
eukprot:CAMPEP_0205903638 /NCGR_PEP_ID=MMETSP1325-20131115/226_1 /ASSEMBLY_ACC=CAM_ASM_000708 /TAXON_ID=236786 /ORGANISM="Florenciella sp., Strain RCC1007" /LENGTH=84 /DNA_ID=CAMNT_0053269311 /DNA_START=199 /DNA_END=454 /DNA_ORIENTATION=+